MPFSIGRTEAGHGNAGTGMSTALSVPTRRLSAGVNEGDTANEDGK